MLHGIIAMTNMKILCPEFVVCCAVRKGGCGTSTGFVQEDEKEYAVELWNRRADSGMRKTNVFYEQFREKAEFIKQEIESLEKEIKYAPAEILPELKERIKLLRIMRHQYLEYADKYQKEYKNGYRIKTMSVLRWQSIYSYII